MERIAVRHIRPAARLSGTAATGIAAVGLALGAAIGFLVGEFVGPRAVRAVRTQRRAPRAGKRSVAELVHDAQAALDADLRLRELHLQVLPVGRNALELHGWVPDRQARALAGRLVAESVSVGRLVNCLLVHGEDDLIEVDDEALDDAAVA